MSDLSEEVKEKIKELEDQSNEVEELFIKLLGDIGLKQSAFAGMGPGWAAPSDDLVRVHRKLQRKYETWYSSAKPLIQEYSRDRLDQYEECYEDFRSWIELDDDHARNDKEKATTLGLIPFNAQRDILSAVPNRVENEKLRARKQISRKITGDELQHARELFDQEHIRAAGVIVGVALERHLLTLCENSEQELEFEFMDGISSLAQTLNEAGEINDDDKRLLDHLSGLRNKCAHKDEEDPTKSEAERLLSEAGKFISETG